MVKADEAILRKVLEGENQYMVPLYQRPYQWDTEQWQTLWDDVVELVKDRRDNPKTNHFIGSLVLVPVDAAQSAVSISRFLVVDGQQRLTTLTLLLAAIRDYRNAHEKPYAGERIHNTYLTNQYEEGDRHVKLVPTQQDRDAYFAVINRDAHSGGDDQVGAAFRFFRSRLEEFDDPDDPEDIAHLETAVLMGLTVVSISTHPEDNVHRIFQSLNNTGLKLTQGDLIRNFIFMGLPTRGEGVHKRYWMPMQNLLPTNEALEQLFWLDLLATKPTLKINDTFNEYQKKLSNLGTEDDIEHEVARLASLAGQYALILDPAREKDPGVRFRLKRLKAWDASTPHALMLELLRRRAQGSVSNEELERALHLIESYLVRRLLMGQSTQGLNRIFPQILNQLDDQEPVDRQIHRLLSTGRRHFATDERVRAGVAESPYFLNGRRSHRSIVLRWLEESFGSKEPVDTAKLSIEHIMPQTLNAEWRAHLASVYGDDQVEEMHNATVHTLGNLTLTGYNSEMGNKSFDLKKDAYLKSGLALNRTLEDFQIWGPDEIRERARLLADQIIDTWPGPIDVGVADTDLSPLWSKVRSIVATIPAGHWARYGDVAAAAGTNAQSVGNHLAEHEVLNAHRVLRGDGAVAENFRWLDPRETRTAREVLTDEGLEFTSAGKADPEARVPLEKLLILVEVDDEPAMF
ncbi:6-O-methylguanine DNA methyltransferase, DNA binding domain [Corynebacterium atrinae]|uniref:GmrSD restriction endonuclease domain-containing protein n=1 Tax=Corynebacterium atrinae TaxID=1336740 RepID=UPI0025B36780|nr:DUF262 domain-containing protein [Corynebacterium atrinae]WJY64181.1 6-O-methylguanine DNA methyltransferase, DNA binding domain [Corynebacterium atrinae]